MIHEKVNFEHYYDGHYIDSGKSQKQREDDLKLSLEEDKKLKSWSEVDC